MSDILERVVSRFRKVKVVKCYFCNRLIEYRTEKELERIAIRVGEPADAVRGEVVLGWAHVKCRG